MTESKLLGNVAAAVPTKWRTKGEIERADERPITPPVNPNGIPASLKDRPHWICWKYIRKGGAWIKLPVDPNTGGAAKVNDHSTWTDFATALKKARGNRNLAGVAFVFTADGPECGVDLDDAIDPATGELLPSAAEIVAAFATYTERSPSGTGVKLFLLGRKPAPECNGKRAGQKIEVYDRGRYFCATGDHWPMTPRTVEPRQEELNGLYARYFDKPNNKGGEIKPTHANGKPAAPGGPHNFIVQASATVMDRARAYLDKMPAAISGGGRPFADVRRGPRRGLRV